MKSYLTREEEQIAYLKKIISDCKKDGITECNVSNGNNKLVTTDKVRFIIWNLPAEKTCPFATEHCKEFCYAKKAEKLYPDCLPSRERNYAESQDLYFVRRMVYTIAKRVLWDIRHNRKTVIRIHESGDFYSVAYACKWLSIMENFNGFESVHFMAYTKSKEYIDQAKKYYHVYSNSVIRYSIWDDSNPDYVASVKEENAPYYTAYDRSTLDTKKASGEIRHECRCADCGSCGCCWNSKVTSIGCEIH